MKTDNRLKIWETALLAGLAVCLLCGAAALRAQDKLADKVVRLHVLANSDSTADQALKLQVRDAVLEHTTGLLNETEDSTEAAALLRRELPELERIAAEVIHACGYGYSVRAEVSVTEFPTREYAGFRLPAGEYLALRILIGEGAGQNWWCVVFPPLCSAVSADISVAAAGLSAEEISLITEPEYVLKFKTIELWETIRQKLEKTAG